VYIDESVIKQAVSREHGYALKGKKIFGKVKGKRTRKYGCCSTLEYHSGMMWKRTHCPDDIGRKYGRKTIQRLYRKEVITRT
jgi:hypothetical protein